jgi:sn1-specific diacylglycerol lipase
LRKITIDEEPYSEMDTYIHVGVHSTAVTIKNILSDKEILSRAFSEHPDYSLVIVGHSLGAGAATALGIILREFFPNLTCYTYSPVGCAFSYPVMEYTKKFVTSFVVGNDLISRTTLRSLIHLCSWMSRLLRHTQRPKYQIVLGSWLNCCSSRDSHSSFPIVHRPRNLSSILFSVYCAKKFGRIWQNKTRKGYVHNFQKYIKKEILFPTFAAGRIILMEMEDSNSTTICCNQEEAGMSVLWYPNEDLGVIRIGNGTIDHHVPNEVIAAFNTVKRQFSLLPDS